MGNDAQKTKQVEVNCDIGYLITNISYGIRQYFDRLYVNYDITYPQSRVLTRLFAQLDKADVNQRDLEYALGIKASSVSSLVRNLEQKGFVRCERMAEDTRNKRVMLTEKGIELKGVVEEARIKAEMLVAKGIPEQDQQVFLTCLAKVLENLNEV